MGAQTGQHPRSLWGAPEKVRARKDISRLLGGGAVSLISKRSSNRTTQNPNPVLFLILCDAVPCLGLGRICRNVTLTK